MEDRANCEIHRVVDLLLSQQCEDGAWRFCFETGPMTDACMIILLQALGCEPELVQQLAMRIVSLQAENGAWRLYADEVNDGNLSATVQAYYALLTSGLYAFSDERLARARQFILANGGLENIGMSTRVILSFTNQMAWKRYSLPAEWLLLPTCFPLNFYDFVGYARVHIAPVLLGAGRHPKLSNRRFPDLNHLLSNPAKQHVKRNPDVFAPDKERAFAHRVTGTLRRGPALVRQRALRRAEQFILARVESDGTLYSYASATFLMVFSFLSLGYPANHPVIGNAIRGLKSLISRTGQYFHLQNSTSTVWDTGLLSYALQATGIPAAAPCIQSATRYLLDRQHQRRGDWHIHNKKGPIGGWGFSDVNTTNPDVDDTAAALRAIAHLKETNLSVKAAWNRGLQWLLSMQNPDGGWPAFERKTDKQVLSAIEIDGAKAILTDPSTPDLTGRTLEFLGNYAYHSLRSRHVAKAVQWLLRQQQTNGSWRGRWGVSYIYGTWAALTGLAAVGVPSCHPAIQRGVQWLLQIQNPDGGWGESCNSEICGTYIPFRTSTLSQTAWALDALIAVCERPIPAIDGGVGFLVENGRAADAATLYPTGAGLPGGFNIHYHSYRFVWPLLALGHYRSRYSPAHGAGLGT